MTKYNVVSPRPKHNEAGKVWWHNIGNATMNDKGNITIYLNSLPIPDAEGQIRIMLFEKDETQTRTAKPKSNDVDDEIPF